MAISKLQIANALSLLKNVNHSFLDVHQSAVMIAVTQVQDFVTRDMKATKKLTFFEAAFDAIFFGLIIPKAAGALITYVTKECLLKIARSRYIFKTFGNVSATDALKSGNAEKFKEYSEFLKLIEEPKDIELFYHKFVADFVSMAVDNSSKALPKFGLGDVKKYAASSPVAAAHDFQEVFQNRIQSEINMQKAVNNMTFEMLHNTLIWDELSEQQLADLQDHTAITLGNSLEEYRNRLFSYQQTVSLYYEMAIWSIRIFQTGASLRNVVGITKTEEEYQLLEQSVAFTDYAINKFVNLSKPDVSLEDTFMNTEGTKMRAVSACAKYLRFLFVQVSGRSSFAR